MTKAHKEFGGLTRMQMRDIYHSEKTKRQLAIKYGVTERVILAVIREVGTTRQRMLVPAR